MDVREHLERPTGTRDGLAGEEVLRTLLVTDLVDSTRLVEKLGDVRAAELAVRHDRVARDLLPRFHGLEIDKTDGFLLLFERPVDAVGYALAYHRALAELSVELGAQLQARAGIHLGTVFLRRNSAEDVARGAKPVEVEGLAKPTAARVMTLAAGKQTLLTAAAFDLARQAADGELEGDLRWLAHGPYLFKGMPDPLEIFEVGVDGLSALAVPPDREKARRAVAAGDEVTLGWRPGPGQEVPHRAGWFLERRLGGGGFGEVWLAVQRAVGESRVFKFCHDAERLRSLQREVTLFRLLKNSLGDRPEIVRIYDWQFDRAPYFLEAEHVAGGSLVDWAESEGGLETIPLEDRLELVAQVADALAAAHSVGVLHKDVKPHNVLVRRGRDGKPRAKLTDFGIGEVVDQQELLARGITVLGMTEAVTPGTEPSSVTGSHLYMAPEVSEGRAATVQADVYALGVLLFQMVAGDFRRALASGWRRRIDDPLLAGDIADMVDGDPERRPASAREVAGRLRRLDQRRAERAAERRAREEAEAQRLALERAQRRRRAATWIATAAVTVLALVSVLAVAATRARAEAERARSVADQRRTQAEDLISFMLGDLREKLEPVGRLEILDDVGDKALDYFAGVSEEELSDDELFRRSKALSQIGSVRIAQGDLDAALRSFEESLALAGDLVARDPGNDTWQAGLGEVHFWIGNVHWLRDELPEAEERFRAYYEVAETLVRIAPDKPDWRLEVAYAHSNLGTLRDALGQVDEALEHFRRAVEIKRELLASEPDNPRWQRELADSLSWLGQVLESRGETAAALEAYRENHGALEALASRDPENTSWQHRLGISHNKLGWMFELAGDLAAAWSHYQASLQVHRSLVSRDPTNADWLREEAVGHFWLGSLLETRGDLRQARSELETSRDALRRLYDLDPGNAERLRDLARVLFRLGGVLAATGEPGRALDLTRSAVAMVEPMLSSEDALDRQDRRLAAEGLSTAGVVFASAGRRAEARVCWERAVVLLRQAASGSGDARLRAPLAEALLRLDRVDEAREIVEDLVSRGYRKADLLALCREKGLTLATG